LCFERPCTPETSSFPLFFSLLPSFRVFRSPSRVTPNETQGAPEVTTVDLIPSALYPPLELLLDCFISFGRRVFSGSTYLFFHYFLTHISPFHPPPHPRTSRGAGGRLPPPQLPLSPPHSSSSPQHDRVIPDLAGEKDNTLFPAPTAHLGYPKAFFHSVPYREKIRWPSL